MFHVVHTLPLAAPGQTRKRQRQAEHGDAEGDVEGGEPAVVDGALAEGLLDGPEGGEGRGGGDDAGGGVEAGAECGGEDDERG